MDALTRELHDPPQRRQRKPVRGAPTPMGSALTEQEVAILHLMAQGMTYEQIGRMRFMETNTVKWHAQRIYRRLGARNAAHAVHIGWQRGLLGGSSTAASTPVHGGGA